MLFNPCKSKDFLPQFDINNQPIELVEHTKLLGLVISSDLSWNQNTNYMTGRCNAKLWVLRRLKKLGARDTDLVDVYCKQIRSILEFGSPVWNPSITGEQISQIERIQKTALHIILGTRYRSYTNALKLTGLEKLSIRRSKLDLKFARKALKHEKFKKWFQYNEKTTKIRFKQPRLCPIYTRTERYKKSPICTLTEILNKFFEKK